MKDHLPHMKQSEQSACLTTPDSQPASQRRCLSPTCICLSRKSYQCLLKTTTFTEFRCRREDNIKTKQPLQCCPQQRSEFTSTVPLKAFTNVPCTETGSVWGVKRVRTMYRGQNWMVKGTRRESLEFVHFPQKWAPYSDQNSNELSSYIMPVMFWLLDYLR